MNELKYTLKSITQKTGIEFTVRLANADDVVKYIDAKILSSKEANKTSFRFSFKGTDYVATLSGADKITANYAYLLCGLLENSGSADLSLGLNDYLKKIVLGECTGLQVQKFHVKFNVPDIPCYALVICAESNKNEILNILESYSSNFLDTPVMTEDGNFVYVKYIENAEIEYQSPTEFAEFLSQSIFEELGFNVKIGVGAVVKHLSDIPSSFQQALTCIKMSDVFNSKGFVYSYKDFVLMKILGDLPRAKLKEYLEVLSGNDAENIFSDEDMMSTAEEFLDNSLNVSETARNLFMHRNTLIYRLDKIEKSTGLNIKDFSDAVTFRLITLLYKVLGQ